MLYFSLDTLRPVDQYLAKMMAIRTGAGDLKYKTFCKVVMALSHGNANAKEVFQQIRK